jgi:hypothetical protein
MPEYRKAGLRTFYRIDGEEVVKVHNREKFSSAEVSVQNWIVLDTATDPQDTEPITEQEFLTQYNEALTRIKEMKI